MARLQIVRLPDRVVGEYVKTPYAAVIDQLDLPAAGSIDRDEIAKQLGAVGVIYSTTTLDVVQSNE